MRSPARTADAVNVRSWPPPNLDRASLAGQKVLITGAGGFLGVNLTRGLAERGAQVVALVRRQPDDAARWFLASAQSQVEWRLGDVTDRKGLATIAAEGISTIVHAAAVTATREQERESTSRVFEVNAVGSLNALEAARRGGVQRFVLVSSGGLYGPAPPAPPLNESTPMRSDNLYGIAKAASERLTIRYHELHEFDVAIGRLGTTYGPMERPSGSRTNLSAVQQAVAAMRAAPAGSVVSVRGADVARDFLHVADAVDAFARMVGAPRLGHDVYNVGAPVSEPLSTALDALSEATGVSWREAGPDEPAQLVQTAVNARAAMDTRRLEEDLGWRFSLPLARGARATLEWLDPSAERTP